MTKAELHAIKEALICLLQLHLPNQRWKNSKEMEKAQAEYIAKTTKLLEQLDDRDK